MSHLQPSAVKNEFGIATLSLGNWREHRLQPRLEAAAKAGYQWIDLFDEFKSLDMRIACTQPLRQIEGIKDPAERRASLDLVAKRFPFMRAFDTDLVFMCANIRTDRGVTSDLKTVARDLAELGDMAAAYSRADGGRMIRIGYEGLSWATRNTWSSSWEAVRFANRPNVGLIIDAFNILAVEFADPYNPAGHGRIYPTLEESLQVLAGSLASLARSVPGEKIFFYQCGDAELVNPATFLPPADSKTPALLPWSRSYRLYPLEQSRGGYMPVELVTAAVLATGYAGPISHEVFNSSLNEPGSDVPDSHATRGIASLETLINAATNLAPFWSSRRDSETAISQVTQRLQTKPHKL
ncbi:hypothetical protein N7492_003193 [Penicillium capsulatum]|uniref:Xylose isomerase-like TIM barrel domain-containing protein n=1 Tax=Penicillium capsulatum TaxID=69766 RepID=A0A9W9IJ13_9EURO|nr:hypothetical protein N7492_003193 [Penicillium capsulatum]KAJ6122219.1 hypothetical protein N7512_004684 [Penicillium capsulatum]